MRLLGRQRLCGRLRVLGPLLRLFSPLKLLDILLAYSDFGGSELDRVHAVRMTVYRRTAGRAERVDPRSGEPGESLSHALNYQRGDAGLWIALEDVGRRNVGNNDTSIAGKLFSKGRLSQIICRVRSDSVTVTGPAYHPVERVTQAFEPE